MFTSRDRSRGPGMAARRRRIKLGIKTRPAPRDVDEVLRELFPRDQPDGWDAHASDWRDHQRHINVLGPATMLLNELAMPPVVIRGWNADDEAFYRERCAFYAEQERQLEAAGAEPSLIQKVWK